MARGRPKGSKNKKNEVTIVLSPTIASEVILDANTSAPQAYSASIKILGKFYEAQGTTALEAISNLKPEGVARGVTVLKLTKGKRSQERILPKLATVRLFAPSKMMREYALKNAVERFSI